MPSRQKMPGSNSVNELTLDAQKSEQEQETVPNEREEKPRDRESQLVLKLSATLVRKLTDKAQIEGVKVDELAGELIAEGLVLRAWEIMERKNAMRSAPAGGGNGSHGSRGQKFGFRHQNQQRKNVNSYENGAPNSPSKGSLRQNYKHIMDDNANFLEYVRNQEKGREKY